MKPNQDSDFLGLEINEVLSNEEKKILKTFLEFFINITDKYDLKDKEIKITLEDKEENYIPCSIFSIKLGIFEAIVKFFHENKSLSFKQISKVLDRTPNNIAVTYKKAKIKYPQPFTKLDFSVKVPFKIFSKKFTCFESICLYLKDKLDYSYHKIAVLLNRNDRTIWTVYNRARLKSQKQC